MSQPLHHPHRPDWLCEDCGLEWPCPPARDRLRAEAGGDLAALRVLMWAFFDDFCLDASEQVLDEPFRRIFERFIGWTRPVPAPEQGPWKWDQQVERWVEVPG